MVKTKMKSHVVGMTLRVGGVSAVGRLVSVQAPKSNDANDAAGSPRGSSASKFKMITHNGDGVQQVYRDTKGVIWEQSELARAFTDNDAEVHVITAKEAKDATASKLPKNVANLTPHQTDSLKGEIYPGTGNSFVFEPNTADPFDLKAYEFLKVAVQSSGMTFLTTSNIRNSENFYRLNLWRGHLVLEPLIFPEELNDHYEDEAEEVSPTIVAKIRSAMKSWEEPFDSENYYSERFAGWQDNLVADQPTAAIKEAELLSLIESLNI